MKRMILLFVLLGVSLCGCSSNNLTADKEKIDFFAQVQTSSNNEVDISLQLISPDRDMEADSDFQAKMELFNGNKEIRAEANMPERPFMKKGEIYQIFTWRGQLDPGSYELKWSSDNYEGTNLSFEVVENSSGSISIGNLSIVNSPEN